MVVKNITSTTVEIDAPAKINLFLEVLNKREDGYHSINSLFQAVSLYDNLKFELTDRPGFKLTFKNSIDLPNDDDNLIIKAYKLMREKYKFKKGIRIRMEKNIPISAGLGGGSADAAATISACNILYDIKLTNDEMARIGLEIGSDVPFFFSSGQALVTGRGEIIQESDFLIDYSVVLVNPKIAVSTAEGYTALKRDLTKQKNPFNLGRCRTIKEFSERLGEAGNDFEEIQCAQHPELQKVKDDLYHCGALLAQMSGSGPTFYGIFDSFENVNIDASFEKRDWQIYTVEPITLRSI